jgi:hypothetical protein
MPPNRFRKIELQSWFLGNGFPQDSSGLFSIERLDELSPQNFTANAS